MVHTVDADGNRVAALRDEPTMDEVVAFFADPTTAPSPLHQLIALLQQQTRFEPLEELMMKTEMVVQVIMREKAILSWMYLLK
jgi:hypothetical protein